MAGQVMLVVFFLWMLERGLGPGLAWVSPIRARDPYIFN